MEKTRILLQDLVEKAETYTKSSIEITKLRVVKTTADMAGALISHVVLLVVLTSALLLLNVGVSLYVGECIGSISKGFLLVSVFYLIIAILTFFFLQRIIHAPVARYVIRKLLNQHK
jgi:hypothetical protein